MKKKQYLGSIVAGMLLSFSSFGQINFAGGRVAMSFDGNIEDDDDIVALPLSMALMKASGLSDKVVHVEYNNNKCGGPTTVQEDNNDVAAFAGNDAVHMRNSAAGSSTRFGFATSLFYDHTLNATEAVTNLAAEINLSTASNPLYIIAGGPMESVWRALNASDKTKHSNVFVISHSGWNQSYARCSASSHDWTKLKQSFPNVYYVENGTSATDPHQLADQNGGLNTAISAWDWMKNSTNADLKWIHSRNPFSGKFDPSDAGMVYYVITGGPLNGGKKKPTVTDVKNLLLNPVTNPDGNVAPIVAITAPLANANFPIGSLVTFTANASDSDGTIASVSFANGSNVIADESAPYSAAFSFATSGTFSVVVTATDNKGKKTSVSRTITIGTVVSGNPTVSFLQPLQGASVSKNIIVKVAASDIDGSVSNVKLYLDGNLVRQENVNPYVWNSTSGGSLDPVLSNLSAGVHLLKSVATDNSGKTSETAISITVVSSLRESEINVSEMAGTETFPNPCLDQFIFRSGANNDIYSIKLVSLEGSEVHAQYTFNSATEVLVNTSSLQPGIYQLEVSSFNGTLVQKVLKQ